MKNQRANKEWTSAITKARKSNKNKYGYKGVSLNIRGGNYTASINIRINGKSMYKSLGTYPTPLEASEARTKYILSLI